jgi:protein involved in polysaccharide export with SLBB domain
MINQHINEFSYMPLVTILNKRAVAILLSTLLFFIAHATLNAQSTARSTTTGTTNLGSINAGSLNIEGLKRQCQRITQQQRQLARTAGYNIDEICQTLESLDPDSLLGTQQPAQSRLQNRLARDAQVMTDERGVIVDVQPEQDLSFEDLFLNESQMFELLQAKEFQEQMMLLSPEEEEEPLKPFGYEIFSSTPTTFAPVTDIATPENYIVGPGDSLSMQLLGGESQSYTLEVTRDGTINIPDIGELFISGLTFDETKDLITEKVSEQLIGVRVIINLSELRSIRVFVLGEAFKPGSYSVSSLSTMTNAIMVSGGVTDIASLRNIELKRNGETVSRLDLYQLLLSGDTSGDKRLMPGDVIFIPPVGKTISIQGEVKRPAIYELKDEQNLMDVIDLAGGISARAYKRIVSVERPNESGFTTTEEYDLANNTIDYRAQAGDIINVMPVLEASEGVVSLSGHFHRPRNIAWTPGLTLGDIIQSASDFMDGVDLHSGLIIRRELPLKNVTVKYFDIAEVLSGGADHKIELLPLDEVMAFDMFEDRTVVMEELMNVVMNQTTMGGLKNIVHISGNVKYPGDYPYGRAMLVQHLVAIAGGLKEATYLGRAEITRRSIDDEGVSKTEHININLADLISDNQDFQLQPRDKLSIYITPEYQERRTIEISGEVRFPGNYEFSRGDTLSQVIKRAGGFTDLAHVQASVFTREELRIREAEQLKELQRELEREVAASELGEQAVGAKTSSASISNAQKLLESLNDTVALGRLIIQLDEILAGEKDDILLKDGDVLVVPPFKQEVSVVGEVQKGSSHLYNQEWLLDDYIEGSGGYTNRADTDRIYVVRADGSIFLPNQGGWLTHQTAMISAGDTIVVPLEADRIKTLTLWTSVSQIIYQLALGAAAVSRL